MERWAGGVAAELSQTLGSLADSQRSEDLLSQLQVRTLGAHAVDSHMTDLPLVLGLLHFWMAERQPIFFQVEMEGKERQLEELRVKVLELKQLTGNEEIPSELQVGGDLQTSPSDYHL